MKVAVLDIKGKETGRKADLSDAVYGIEPNNHAIYLDVKQYMAHQRQGTHKAKERAEICLLYTSPSPRDRTRSRMPSSA